MFFWRGGRVDSMLIGFEPRTFGIQGDGLNVNSDIWRFVIRSD